MNIRDINTQWEKVVQQYLATSTKLNKVRESENIEDGNKLKAEINNLQQELGKLSDLIPVPADSVEDLERRLAALQDPPSHIEEFSPPQQKRKNLNSSLSSSKRTRRSSGIITLEELKRSIRLEPDRLPSIEELQKCTTAEAKIQLLFLWEEQSVCLQVRSCFHQGFYLQKLKNSNNYSTSDLVQQFPQIGENRIKRNLQLFNRLGNYRKILYSTLAISRLWNSITSIENELKQLAPEEANWWKAGETSDPSCFFKAYKLWFQHDVSKNVFYELDIYDNNLSRNLDSNIVQQLCTIVKRASDVNIQHFDKLVEDLDNNKCMIWYHNESSPAMHAVYAEKNNNTWETSDEVFKQDWENKLECKDLAICFLKE